MNMENNGNYQNCPHCGGTHPPEAKSCPTTGHSISTHYRVCPSCGEHNEATAAFCPHCGFRHSETKLSADKLRISSKRIGITAIIAFVAIALVTAGYLSYPGIVQWVQDTFAPSSDAPVAEPEEPTIFPDQLLAFSSSERGSARGNDIWIIDPNNPLNIQQLTNQDDINHIPLWSPDGTSIAFTRRIYDQDSEMLYVINADGSGLRQVTGEHDRIIAKFWSPDGARIYVVTSPMGGPCSFAWVDANGTSDQTENIVVGADHAVCDVDISPTWDQLVFRGYGMYQNINVGDFTENGTRLENIRTIVPVEAFSESRENVQPSWSPDGTRIAIVVDEGDYLSNLYTVAPDGSALKKITFFTDAYVSTPKWSRDSEWIAVSVLYYYNDPAYSDILIIPSDGAFQPMINLTDDLFNDGAPDWNPIPLSTDALGSLPSQDAFFPEEISSESDALESLCGDQYESNLVVFSPDWGEMKSDTTITFAHAEVPDAMEYSISGQLDDGMGGIIGHVTVFYAAPSISIDIHNCSWNFMPDYDCAAVVDEVLGQSQVVFRGVINATIIGDQKPNFSGSFCVIFQKD